jgi:hypothetical protein
MRGSVFEHVGNEKLSASVGSIADSNTILELPEVKPSILPDTSYLRKGTTTSSVVQPVAAEAEAVGEEDDSSTDAAVVEGDSVLCLRASKKHKASTQNFSSEDMLCQSVSSPVIVVSNPTDDRVLVSEFWVDIFTSDGTWVKVETRVGYSYDGYYGRQVNYFDSAEAFSVDQHSHHELLWKGTLRIPKGNHEPYGNPSDRRIHNAFPDPFKARLNLKDDAGKVKTLYYEVSNEPLDHLWSTYEEAVAVTESADQFGADFNCDMWLCVENPITLAKSVICVTSAKSNPKHWTVRMSSDSRSVPGSTSYVYPSTLNRAAFQASRAEEKASEIELDAGSAQYCKLTGLVNYETNQVYALHGVIHIQNEAGETVAFVEAYLRLDYDAVKEDE